MGIKLIFSMESYLEQYLKSNSVEYGLYTHPAVYTVEEAKIHCKDVPGLGCKNLFLKDKEEGKFFLVIMPAERRLQMKELAPKIGAKKLTFANEEELLSILKLTPGAVSPLGLINDKDNLVIVIIDKEVWDAELVSFHPNVNTESITLNKENFHKFIASLQNNKKILTSH